MTNDKTDFGLICPLCGASDHKMYAYKGVPVFSCPKAPKDTMMSYDISSNSQWAWVDSDLRVDDKGYCGLSPLETGEQDPYWRDGVCEQHDKRFIEGKKSTWVVTRDFVTGATKTMLRGAWAVAGYPWYLLVGGLGGAVRYALKRGKK